MKKKATDTPLADQEPLKRDSLLTLLRGVLPPPLREEASLDGSTLFEAGDPGEVVVRVSTSKVIISVFGVVWKGPYTTEPCPQQFVSLSWTHLPAAHLTKFIHFSIEMARQLRRAKYRTCEMCGRITPPEWMHDATTCQSCASEHLGIVY